MVEYLSDQCEIHLIQRLAFGQFHKLFGTKTHQGVIGGKLGVPVFQEGFALFQQGVPCHHKGLVQIGFPDVHVDASLGFFTQALLLALPLILYIPKALHPAPPVKVTAGTAENSVCKGLGIRVAPHRPKSVGFHVFLAAADFLLGCLP